MTAVVEQTSAWLASFTQQPSAAPWLEELRDAGFRSFAGLGFPTTHEEEWRFTNVAPIARTTFELAAPGSGVGLAAVQDSIRIVFVNGRPANLPQRLPKGVQVGTFSGDPDGVQQHLAQYARYQDEAFVALNTAFLGDGAYVRIARGSVVEQPIELVYLTGPSAQPVVTHPRALVIVGAGAQCTLLERYEGPDDTVYFTNAVTEIVAAEGAIVDSYKLQLEGRGAFHVATLQAQLGRSANFSANSISLGGALVRNNVNAVLSEGTEATLNGLYLVNGGQHVDNHTTVDHAKPHGTSHELYKGILNGKASAVFNGRILVRKDAQKTDSKQTNKNLVLSDEAVIHTKPELQIFADDVRCTHGATIGQLDGEALFYMQSRGIGKKEARNLLTYAFAQDIIDRVRMLSLRDSLEKILFERFHENAG